MPYLVGGIMTYYLFKSIEDSMMQSASSCCVLPCTMTDMNA